MSPRLLYFLTLKLSLTVAGDITEAHSVKKVF